MANRMSGRIVDITVTAQSVNITLDNDPAQGPKGNTFLLGDDHANRNAAFSLALAAAANRWPITIRISGDGEITPTAEATVRFVAVAWAAG